MLIKIGTAKELVQIPRGTPFYVFKEIRQAVEALDRVYGSDRDYLQLGGYLVLVEDQEVLQPLKLIVNYETHPPEWAYCIGIGESQPYITALFIMNDDTPSMCSCLPQLHQTLF